MRESFSRCPAQILTLEIPYDHHQHPLADEQQLRLQALADHVGLSAEEYLQRRLKELLDRPDSAFDDAAAYVVRKNEELYRRLA